MHREVTTIAEAIETQLSGIESSSEAWNQIQNELEHEDVALVTLLPQQENSTSVRIEYGDLIGDRHGYKEFAVDDTEYRDLVEDLGEKMEDYQPGLFYTPEDDPYSTEIY